MTLSHSIVISPRNAGHKYIAKLIRADDPLPLPSAAAKLGMRAIANRLAHNGDEELLPGDALIEIEANSPPDEAPSGYSCHLTIIDAAGKLRRFTPTSYNKGAIKAGGIPVEYLPGAGPTAACVRIIHAQRMGIAWE